MTFYKVQIDEALFNEALKISENLPKYRLNFKQKLEENDGDLQAKVAGTIGELVVERWLQEIGIEYRDERHVHTHDYVLISGNLTLEVKTKLRTVAPIPNYECSVPAYTRDMQNTQLYIFVSLTEIKSKEICAEKYPTAYIKGVITKKRFDKISRRLPFGSVDPSNGFDFKKDCYNVYAKELTSPSRFLSVYKEKYEQQFDHY